MSKTQETGPYQIMNKINGKVSYDSVKIKGPKIQIGWVSDTVSDLFSYPDGITGDDIYKLQGNLWSTSVLSKNRE